MNLFSTTKSGRLMTRRTPNKRPAKTAKPRLLTGGNPQIPKGDGDGPVQAYIKAMPGWKRAIGKKLDQLIVENVPEVRKAVRWNTPFFGLNDDGWFVAFGCTTRYVKVTFFKGTLMTQIFLRPSWMDGSSSVCQELDRKRFSHAATSNGQ